MTTKYYNMIIHLELNSEIILIREDDYDELSHNYPSRIKLWDSIERTKYIFNYELILQIDQPVYIWYW